MRNLQPSDHLLWEKPSNDRPQRTKDKRASKSSASRRLSSIFPEIVTGLRGQSVKSDIFSFGKLGKRVFVKAKLGPLCEFLNGTSIVASDKRASVEQVLETLSV